MGQEVSGNSGRGKLDRTQRDVGEGGMDVFAHGETNGEWEVCHTLQICLKVSGRL